MTIVTSNAYMQSRVQIVESKKKIIVIVIIKSRAYLPERDGNSHLFVYINYDKRINHVLCILLYSDYTTAAKETLHFEASSY